MPCLDTQQQHVCALTDRLLLLLSCYIQTAEGQNRLFDVISKAAEAREVDRAGVWTSVGQPYVCLGVPQQVRGHVRMCMSSKQAHAAACVLSRCKDGQHGMRA
jgi:hypothetical protein